MNQNTYECENAVIGALLADSRKLIDIDLSASHFENVNLGLVFDCIKSMANRGDVADLFTVSDELSKTYNKDWITYLATVQSSTAGASLLKEYSKHIKRYSVERNAKQIAGDMISAVQSEGMTAVDTAIKSLMALGRETKKTTYTMKEALRAVNDNLTERIANGGGLSGITSGLEGLDELLGGFQDTDLIVIGARPAMGKTALMLNLILNGNVASGFFSSEMAAMQGAMRMISTMGRVNAGKLRNADMGEHEWAGYTAGVGILQPRPIFIDDQSKPTIDDVQRQARIWKQENDIKCLHVDYIQRIDAMDKRAPKHLQVEEVAQGLKSLAKELQIPVIALAQVNRNVETRSNKRPNMGDLKDSGSVEQEADQIMMLYREEVYDKETNDKGIAELSVEKNRHGQIGGVRLSWEAQYMKFDNIKTGYEGY